MTRARRFHSDFVPAGPDAYNQPERELPEAAVGVHDWTLVNAGIFHAFHSLWISQINNVLNEGLLPNGFYALPEQQAGRTIADVLTLHASPASGEALPPATGATTVAEAPPRVRRWQTLEAIIRPRSLAIRHVSGRRLIAIVPLFWRDVLEGRSAALE